jgi:hypothetical protein
MLTFMLDAIYGQFLKAAIAGSIAVGQGDD